MGMTACTHGGGHAGGGPSGAASGAASPSAKPTHESSSKQAPKSKTSKSAQKKTGSKSKNGSNPTEKSTSGGKSQTHKKQSPTPQKTHTSKPPSNGTYDDTSDTGAKAPHDQHKVVQKLPGKKTKTKQCVNVGKKADVHSQKIAMGNFVNARKAFKQAKTAYNSDALQMYVIPTSRKKAGVKVEASLEGSHSESVKVESKHFSRAAQWKYYPVEIKLAHSGTWRFNVTSGKDHGCFEARFTS